MNTEILRTNLHRVAPAARAVRFVLWLLLKVLFVYPACMMALLVIACSGFTFSGIAHGYVAEVSIYAGKPATDTQITSPTCVQYAPQVQTDAPALAPRPCIEMADRLTSKAELADRLADGLRSFYALAVLLSAVISYFAWMLSSGYRSPGTKRADEDTSGLMKA